MTGRFNARNISALVLTVIVIIFIGSAMRMTWWNLSQPYVGTDVSTDFDLDEFCISYPPETVCVTYQTFIIVETAFVPVADTFELTNILLLAGFMVAILTLILLIIGVFLPKVNAVIPICGTIGSVLVLLAPIHLFAFLPGAVSSWKASQCSFGFFGSTTCGSIQYNTGGGLGWFFAIFTFVLFLIVAALSYKIARNADVRDK